MICTWREEKRNKRSWDVSSKTVILEQMWVVLANCHWILAGRGDQRELEIRRRVGLKLLSLPLSANIVKLFKKGQACNMLDRKSSNL